MTANRPTVVLAIPTSPPYSGPEIVGDILSSMDFGDEFRVIHFGTTINKGNSPKGQIRFDNVLTFGRLAVQFVQLLRRSRARITYLYLSQNTIGFVRDSVLIAIARSCGAHVIAHIHGGNFASFYLHSNALMKLAIRQVLRRISTLLILAEKFRSQVETLCPHAQVMVVRNPVDTNFILPAPEPERPGGLKILFLGHLSAAKGFPEVLEALPTVFAECPDAVFECAGEWFAREQNIRFSEDGRPVVHDSAQIDAAWSRLLSRYPDRVQYLGLLGPEAKLKALRRADVLVLPSYSEGLPMVVLEAMAAGLALVVSPVGALPEFLRAPTNAYFVKAGDDSAIARSLIRLAQNPAARKAMGRANRELAASSFSADSIRATLIARFRETLETASIFRPRVLLALPLPPPHSGQEQFTQMILRCGLQRNFDLLHVDTSLREDNAARGTLNPRRLWRSLVVHFTVALALLTKRPDILNVPLAKNRWGFVRAGTLILTGRLSGAAVVSRLGGDHFDQFYETSGPLMRRFIRFVLNRIDSVLVRSDGLKRQFDGLVECTRLHSVYIGLDSRDFERPPAWNRPKDKCLRVVFVGHVSRAKGAFDLLAAVPEVLSKVPNTRFTLVGEQISKELNVVHVSPLEDLDLARDALLGNDAIRDKVILAHARTLDDLLPHYWNADVFVLPSHSEGFPFAALEAMAAGLPLIVTKAGALPEVLNTSNAEFIPFGNAEALASALIRLLQDTSLRETMGANNLQLVRQGFGLEQLRSRMESVFRSTLDRSKAPDPVSVRR